MAWFKKEMDYARERLEEVSQTAIDRAGEKLGVVVKTGIGEASGELREIVVAAGREVDEKLDKIANEITNQRQFTKSDVKELVDYAAQQFGIMIDQRVAVLRAEITGLVQEKVEYFKHEIDTFFIRRQQDLARERRRLIANIAIAIGASLVMAVVSFTVHKASSGDVSVFSVFRIAFLSLTAGYAVYLAAKFVGRYLRMAEHRKDLAYLATRYWGVLRPGSIAGHAVIVALLVLVSVVLLFPDAITRWLGIQAW